MNEIVFALGMLANSLMELRAELAYADVAVKSSVVAYTAPGEEILEVIALCESDNNPEARNASSSAKGRFQIIHSTWEEWGKEHWGESFKDKDIFNYEDNTELAHYGFSKHGVSPWLASKDCWSKTKSE